MYCYRNVLFNSWIFWNTGLSYSRVHISSDEVGQPQNCIGSATPMPFASINSTNQRTNPWNFFAKKYWEMAELENELFFSWPIWICFFVFSNENNLGFHMIYHFFLHYGCFFQNLGKDFIRTSMHTTVI